MKIFHLTSMLAFLITFTFLGCNSDKSKSLDSNAHQQASTTRSFPAVQDSTNDVNCINCRATFKLSRATQKQSNGHSYIACPICNKDYLKKLNNKF